MSDTPRTDAEELINDLIVAVEGQWSGMKHVTAKPVHVAEKRLTDYVSQLERELVDAIVCKVTSERLLNEAEEKLTALREGVEKLAAEYMRLADTSDDEDFITEKRALARELRALLK